MRRAALPPARSRGSSRPARLAGAALALLAAFCATPAPAATQAQAAGDSLATYRALIRAHRGAAALERASAWCATLEGSVGSDTLLAAALDARSEALLDAGAWGDSATHAIAARAVEVKSRALGNTSPEVAASLVTQSWLLYRASRAAEARPLVERALALALGAGAGSERLVYRALHLRASTLEDAAEFTLADSCYRAEMAIALRLEGPEGEMVANTENSMAILARETGRPAEARTLYEHSLAMRERRLGPDHVDVAWSHNNLGNVLVRLGDLSGGIEHLERALAIRERTSDPMHPITASLLHNLARAELLRGDTAVAEAHFRRALAIREAKLQASDLSLGQTRAAIALLAAARGDSATGRRLARQSLMAYERSLGPRHPGVAAQHGHLGDIERFAGDPTGAISEYRLAIGILESALGRDASDLVEELTALAGAERSVGRDAAAFADAARAESLAVRDLSAVASVLEERAALEYDTAVRQALSAMLDAACAPEAPPARVASAWDAVVRSRALVLDALASRHRALLHTDDRLALAIADSLARSRERLAHLALRGASSAAERAGLEAAAARRDRLEAALARRSAAFRHDQGAARAGLAEVLAALPAGEGLLAYARYTPCARPQGAPEQLVAFVASGGQRGGRIVPLGAVATIEARVTAWRRAAGQRPDPLRAELDERRCRAAGEELRAAIWDPVAPLLAGLDRISIVPEGALHAVNFGALPMPRERYLAESGPVLVVLSAERDLVEGEPAPQGTGLLAIADPDFACEPGHAVPALVAVAAGASVESDTAADGYRGRHSSCRDFGAKRFAPLPASAREAATIAALRSSRAPGSAFLELTGTQASESAFKHLAPGKRELHLATHGFLLEDECPGAIAENPLVRCGLALAGANRRDEAAVGADDGVVTGEEIGSLDLSSVECAVLSACECGLGDVKAGEGVLGLERAFRVAGARGVVMSLWPVGDAETAAWMGAFYRARITRALDPAAALAAAEREILRERRAGGHDTHPWSWGAFVATTVGSADRR